jgi:DNA (cytosine-5)-methyltransferase 1
MGVPQRRERVFFIAMRKDLAEPFMVQKDMFTVVPELKLEFNEQSIKYGELALYNGESITDFAMRAWLARKPQDKSIADSKSHVPGFKVTDMNTFYVKEDTVCQTLTSKGRHGCLLYSKPIRLSKEEFCMIGSYPQDYDFITNQWGYLIGMSVPPVMTAQIATEVYNQWISKL